MAVFSADELLQSYAAGERNFECAELHATDLRKANLQGANFSGADLSRANLAEANLSEAILCQANLSRANLEGACLDRANLEKAKMHRINLTGASLREAKLFEVDFQPQGRALSDLRHADLSGADLSFAKLDGSILYQAVLRGTTLYKAQLGIWEFYRSYRTDLREADLTDADLSYADLTGAILRKANLSQADLTNAVLTDTDLTDADLHGAILPNSQNDTSARSALTHPQITLSTAESDGSASESNLNRTWNNLTFHSESQVKIAQALDQVGVLFFPNCTARLTTSEGRQNRQPNFLIFYQGRWGILEVDGEPLYPASSAVQDDECDRPFQAYGIRIIQHFHARDCYEQPNTVVKRFLEALKQTAPNS